MRTFCYLACLVLMALVAEGREAPKKYLLGVNLGPNFVTAAYFTKNDESNPVLIGPIPGGPGYKEWMADPNKSGRRTVQTFHEFAFCDSEGRLVSIPKRQYGAWGYDHAASARIIKEALVQVKTAAKEIPGAPTTIGTISYPYFFDPDSADSMLTAGTKFDSHLKRSWQFRKVLNVARLAYGMDYCHTFGITKLPKLDPIHAHLMIFVDFDGVLLELTFADVTELAIPFEQFRIKAPEYVPNPEVENLRAPGTFGEEAHGKITKAFLKIKESWLDKQPEEQRDVYEFLKGIIFIGDGDKAAFKQLRHIIENVLPASEHGKILDTVDTAFVGAVGAAWLARVFEKYPRLLDPISSAPGWNMQVHLPWKEFKHDEL